MELKYPQWQEPLASAILEFNRKQLREKIQKAEEAIAQRIDQLAFDHGNEHERRALFDGLDPPERKKRSARHSRAKSE